MWNIYQKSSKWPSSDSYSQFYFNIIYSELIVLMLNMIVPFMLSEIQWHYYFSSCLISTVIDIWEIYYSYSVQPICPSSLSVCHKSCLLYLSVTNHVCSICPSQIMFALSVRHKSCLLYLSVTNHVCSITFALVFKNKSLPMFTILRWSADWGFN